MRFKIILLLLLLLSLSTKAQEKITQEVIAKITIEAIDEIFTVKATAINTTQVLKTLKYTLTVFRTTPSNNKSKNSQEGRFTLEANEHKELSSTSINKEEQDHIVIMLLIFNDDRLIATDRFEINKLSEKKRNDATKKNQPEDGIELKGIVVEETKTKPGKDFFDFFYTVYTLNQINGSKIVNVIENLSFGRSTIIKIVIDDTTIFEFLGKPDLEYLEQMSKDAVRRVYRYFQELKKQKEDIFQF
ncbi:CsgE family curli-type amyloid fiber assembly protein [Aquimarina sp. W85]|uniref:CsgE family curli-type amyloid fiber assembly protein n=1 Tax=Aquimarina rhodophyticola TaxID=3342246 RepID=UPI003670027D